MPEKQLVYADLDWSEKPVPSAGRRPIDRGRPVSHSERPVVYSDLDFRLNNSSSPNRIPQHSPDDFPPPPPDFFDSPVRGIKSDPAPGHKAPRPPRPLPPPRKTPPKTGDVQKPSPDLYSEDKSKIHQSMKELEPSLKQLRKNEPPPIPTQYFTSVVYPANPTIKPAQTKPRDPVCNFVGLSDERDLKSKDPELVEKYALNNPVLPDPVFKNDKIYALKNKNIDLFLKCRDVAMILFYDPEDVGQRTGLKKRYADAASITSRYNHGFGSVNCQIEKQLCAKYKITRTPVFSVFTLSNMVGSFRDSTIDPKVLKRYVENVPLIKRQ